MPDTRTSPRLRARNIENRSQHLDSSYSIISSSFSMNLRPRTTQSPIRNKSTKKSTQNNRKRYGIKRRPRTISKPTETETNSAASENNTRVNNQTIEHSNIAFEEPPLSPTPSFTTAFNYTSNSTNDLINDIAQTRHLKNQLKKATVKFDRACRQLILLDQHMNDLQNSYTNSLENDRKTFKIVYRMQLATLEGTHNAYIEYIERQVEKIKKLKQIANLHFLGSHS